MEEMSYEDMSLDQLEKAQQELAEERDATRACQKIVAALLDGKISETKAQHKVAAMTEPEKAALLQVLQPKGIEPVEAVNGG